MAAGPAGVGVAPPASAAAMRCCACGREWEAVPWQDLRCCPFAPTVLVFTSAENLHGGHGGAAQEPLRLSHSGLQTLKDGRRCAAADDGRSETTAAETTDPADAECLSEGEDAQAVDDTHEIYYPVHRHVHEEMDYIIRQLEKYEDSQVGSLRLDSPLA